MLRRFLCLLIGNQAGGTAAHAGDNTNDGADDAAAEHNPQIFLDFLPFRNVEELLFNFGGSHLLVQLSNGIDNLRYGKDADDHHHQVEPCLQRADAEGIADGYTVHGAEAYTFHQKADADNNKALQHLVTHHHADQYQRE